jgi:REP element-mobilizing transposase RayT
MAVHKPVARPGIYFITFTCYKWLPLIAKTNTFYVVHHFLSQLNQKGHQVVGYTIMPNHVHLLLFFAGDARSLNTVIGNLKRFIGYEIIKQLQAQNDIETLAILTQGVVDAERKRGKLHQLWQGSFDVKECRTEKFILQKLNYMHQNPCVERWGLCKNTYDYVHSSAAFYERGNTNNKLLRDYREFMGLLLEMEEREWEELNR